MKRKLYSVLFVLCALSLGLYAQNEITIEPGDNLITTIAEAEDGDVIIIKPGVYKANADATGENENIVIDGKSLTIKGEDPDDKPVIYIRSIDLSGTIGDLTFENIEVSGFPVDAESLQEDPTAEGEEMVGSYFVNMTTELVSIGNLTIKGCVIRNLHRAVIRGDRAEHDVNTITVDDCIIHDIRAGSNYGVFRLQSNLRMSTFVLKNSTLYNVLVGIIQSENTPSGFPKTVTVENCTFYNIGGFTDNRYQFDFKLAEELNFTMRHNIIGKTSPQGLEEDFNILGWRFNFTGTTTARMIANNIAPDFVVNTNSEVWQGSYADINWAQDQFNLDLNPEFADPDFGDFSLSENSPLLEASLEGTPIGDPRWAPKAVNSVGTASMQSTVSVFPNPAMGVVTISMEKPGVVSIYSVLGAKVREFNVTQAQTQVDLSGLNPGVYLVRSDVRGSKAVKLVVK